MIYVTSEAYVHGQGLPVQGSGPKNTENELALQEFNELLGMGVNLLEVEPHRVTIDLGEPGARKLRTYEGTEADIAAIYRAAKQSKRT